MTTLEQDKLNNELIDCKRRCSNQTDMLVRVLTKSDEKDNRIHELEIKLLNGSYWKWIALSLGAYIIIENVLNCML